MVKFYEPSGDPVGARVQALNKLAKASGKFPELRLCQIIANALNTNKDVFYVTDEELSDRLSAYIEWQQKQQEALEKWQASEDTNPKTTRKTDPSNIF